MVAALPDFPWDSLAPFKERARAHRWARRPLGRHPGGPDPRRWCGPRSPTPPTPPATPRRGAPRCCARPSPPGSPAVAGSPGSTPTGCCRRSAARSWWPGCRPCSGSVPVTSSSSPRWPTRRTTSGARIAGATPLPVLGLTAMGPLTTRGTPKLLWVNSPGNPTGQVLPVEHLPRWSAWARQRGVVVASDECYAELDWREDAAPGSVPSILDPRVCGGSHEGLLAVYSLSKQSNVAGYRAAFVAGDPALVARLLEIRKHAGMIVPWPVQQAMVAALGDDAHVAQQKERYRRRRAAAADGAGGRRLPGRPLRRRPLPVGHPRRGRVGDRGRARRPGHPRGARQLLRRGRRPARAGRADRHRRA